MAGSMAAARAVVVPPETPHIGEVAAVAVALQMRLMPVVPRCGVVAVAVMAP